MLLFTCRSDNDPAAGPGTGHSGDAWFYSTSTNLSDPTKWTTPQEIIGSWSETDSTGGCPSYKGWYPTWMSLGAKPGHISTSGHVFYLWGCETGAADGTAPNRQFSSRMFTITTGPPEPSISVVANAEGQSPVIAPKTWIAIQGSNLAPDTRTWIASDFVNGQMPTRLDGVSATVSGKSAFVYYISPTQVNVLTPPDAMNGSVNVVLTNNGTASAAFISQAQPISTSLFVFDATHVIGVHMDGTDIGPTTLYPGLTTPAKPGETMVLFATASDLLLRLLSADRRFNRELCRRRRQ